MLQINDLGRKSSLNERILAAIKKTAESGWYVLGGEGASFEREFAEYCGAGHCVGVANGTDALELALKAAGVKAGDSVVTVANAGMYSTQAINAAGAVPVFADVDPETLLLSPDRLRDALSEDVAAVVVTHLYGLMADMPKIIALTNDMGVPVIEDCAQAHGAELQGRRAGTWGVMGCFSFYPTKNLGAFGDAGAVVTANEALDSRLRKLRQYGWESKYHSAIEGGRNSRLDEIQAAVLRVKLPHLDECNGRRREIAEKYGRLITNGRVLKPSGRGKEHVFHLYVVRCADRSGLQKHLRDKAIASDVHYPVPDHLQKSVRARFSGLSLPVTEKAADEVLTLPCFPEMTDLEVEAVADAVNSWNPAQKTSES